MSNYPLTWIEISVVTGCIIWIVIRIARAIRHITVQKKLLKGEIDLFEKLQPKLLNDSLPAEAEVGKSPIGTALVEAYWNGVFALGSLPYADWIQESRYEAGIFVFLGLLGTVFGVGLAMFSLSRTIGGDAEQINSQIGSVIGALGTAAGCTFAGIVGTLVVSGQNAQFLREASELETEADRFARAKLLPQALRREREREREGIQKAISQATAEAREVNDTHVKNAMEAFRVQVRDSLKEQSHLLQEAIAIHREEVQVTLSKVSESVAMSLQQSTQLIRATTEDSTKTIREGLDGSIAATRDSRAMFNDARDTFSGVRDTIAVTKDTFVTAGQVAKEVVETLDQVRTEFEKAAGELSTSLTAGREQIDLMSPLLNSAKDLLQRVYDAEKSVSASLQDTIQKIGADRAETLTFIREERIITLKALQEDRENAQQTLQSELSDTFTALRNEREAALQVAAAERLTLAKSVEAERITALAALQKGIDDAQNRLNAGLTSVLKELESDRNLTLGALEKDRETYRRDVIDRLTEMLTTLNNSIVPLSTALSELKDQRADLLVGTQQQLMDMLLRFEETLLKVARSAQALPAVLERNLERLYASLSLPQEGAVATETARKSVIAPEETSDLNPSPDKAQEEATNLPPAETRKRTRSQTDAPPLP